MSISLRTAALLLMLSAPATAGTSVPDLSEKGSAVGPALICDTPSQVERVIALQNEGSDMQSALQTINEETQNPRACGVAFVIFTYGEPRANKVMQGKVINIVEITVHAIGDGTRWMRVPATTQYTVMSEQGEDV